MCILFYINYATTAYIFKSINRNYTFWFIETLITARKATPLLISKYWEIWPAVRKLLSVPALRKMKHESALRTNMLISMDSVRWKISIWKYCVWWKQKGNYLEEEEKACNMSSPVKALAAQVWVWSWEPT